MIEDSRSRVSSGSRYESSIGFSRAVRAGNAIAVSGTAPIAPTGETVGIGDPALQARTCLEIVRDALAELGAGLEHVVRTRTMLVRVENWEAVAKVHGEFFSEVRPASTMVIVTGLIDPDWLVEIEADAILDE